MTLYGEYAELECAFRVHQVRTDAGGDYSLLRGYCTSNQKLACVVLFLKNSNTFLKVMYASKLSK